MCNYSAKLTTAIFITGIKNICKIMRLSEHIVQIK